MKKGFWLIVAAVLLVNTAWAADQQPVKGNKHLVTEGFVINADQEPLPGLCKKLTGKFVILTLTSGQEISGVLKNQDRGLVHIQEPRGRELMDAIVRLDQVAAIWAKVRTK